MLTNHSINRISVSHVDVLLRRLGLKTEIVSKGNRTVVIATQSSGRKLTISVRTHNFENGWFVDDPVKYQPRTNHFVVLLRFHGEFSNPRVAPKTWIVPYAKLVEFIDVRQIEGGRMPRLRRDMVTKLDEFIDKWELLTEAYGTAPFTAADEQLRA